MAGDPERLDRMDRRFDAVDGRLERVEVRLDGIDGRLDRIDARLAEHDSRFDRVEARIESSAAETRRHFDVVAESLISQIHLVAEGVLTVDRNVDRLADDVRGELVRVNRRITTLSARIPPKRRR